MWLIKNKHGLHLFYFFSFQKQIKFGALLTTGRKNNSSWELIEVIFGSRDTFSTANRSEGKKMMRKVTKRIQSDGLQCQVMAKRLWTDFFFLSDCHTGTNEWAANLLNWFQRAPGCWLMKCGRTKRWLQAMPQPTHNPSLLFLIGLIILLSLSTLSLGF